MYVTGFPVYVDEFDTQVSSVAFLLLYVTGFPVYVDEFDTQASSVAFFVTVRHWVSCVCR